MKNVLKVLLAMSIVLLTVISVYSQEPCELYQTSVDNVDIVIEHQNLSQKKLYMIVNNELGIENPPEINPYNIACLFGHSISSGSYTSTSHNVSSSAPKCIRYTYTYETCTRDNCGYYVNNLIDTEYLSCH